VLPKRFFEPKTDGYLADKPRSPAEEEEARNYYYSLMGWDAKGIPLTQTVEVLNIK
jgi:aldehyde:ferredoxin oxidoreductase